MTRKRSFGGFFSIVCFRWNDLGEVLLEMRKSVMKVNRERRMQEEHFKER